MLFISIHHTIKQRTKEAGDDLKQQRLEAVLAFVQRTQAATIEQIAYQLQISQSTVRRDVDKLEKMGTVVKRYGGVFMKERWEQSFCPKAAQTDCVKEAVGRAAAALVEENDVVYIESGSTLLYMAKNLHAKNVTVVTADVAIAYELIKRDVAVITLGGYSCVGTFMLVGAMTEQNIKNMHFSKYFTSPSAINAAGKLMYANIQTAALRKKAMEMSSMNIVVADSTKFDQSSFISVKSMQDVQILVTDTLEGLKEPMLPAHVRVVLAEKGE